MPDSEAKIRVEITDGGTIEVLDRAGKKVTELGQRAEDTGTRAERGFSRFQAGIVTLNQGLDLLRRVAAGAGEALETSIFEPLRRVDDITKLSRAIGVATRDLTSLTVAAELSGVGLESLGKNVGFFNRRLVETASGTGRSQNIFRALNIDIRETDGTLRGALPVLLDVADVFKQLPDGVEKSAAAQELFGRSGGQMVNLLNQGSAAIREQIQEARALGLVFDEELGSSAEKLNDDFSRLHLLTQGIRLEIATAALPAVTEIAEQTSEWTQANRELVSTGIDVFIRSLGGAVRGFLAQTGPLVQFFDAWRAFQRDFVPEPFRFGGGGGFTGTGAGGSFGEPTPQIDTQAVLRDLAEAANTRNAVEDTVKASDKLADSQVAVREQARGVTTEFQAQTQKLEDSRRVVLDLGREINTSWQRAIDGALSGGAGGINDIVAGTGKALASSIIGGLLEAELAKNSFDAKVSDNFTITLPGFMQTGADAIGSIWSRAMDFLTGNTDTATRTIGTSFNQLGSQLQGLTRNNPAFAAAVTSSGLNIASSSLVPQGAVVVPGIGVLSAEQAQAAQQAGLISTPEAASSIGLGGLGLLPIALGLGLSNFSGRGLGLTPLSLGVGISANTGAATGALGGILGTSASAAGGLLGALGFAILGAQAGLASTQGGSVTFKGQAGTGIGAAGGAASGAAIGTAVNPGLGTVIGAALGAIVGAILGSLGSEGPTIGTLVGGELRDAIQKAGLPEQQVFRGGGHRGLRAQQLVRAIDPEEAARLTALGFNPGNPLSAEALTEFGQPGHGTSARLLAQIAPLAEANPDVNALKTGSALGLASVLFGGLSNPLAAVNASNALVNNFLLLGLTAEEAEREVAKLAKSTGVTLVGGIEELNRQFLNLRERGRDDIGRLLNSVTALVDVFEDDLPPGVDAAAIVMANFVEGSGIQIASLTDDLKRAVEIFGALEEASNRGLQAGLGAGGQALANRNRLIDLLLGGSSTITIGQVQRSAIEAQAAVLSPLIDSIRDGMSTAITEGVFDAVKDTPAWDALQNQIAAAVKGGDVGDIAALVGDVVNASLGQLDTAAQVLQQIQDQFGLTPTALFGSADQIGQQIEQRQFGRLSRRDQETSLRRQLGEVNAELAQLQAGDVTEEERSRVAELLRRQAELGFQLSDVASQRFASGSRQAEIAAQEGEAFAKAAEDGLRALGLDITTSFEPAVIATTDNTSATVENTAALRYVGQAIEQGIGTGQIQITIDGGEGLDAQSLGTIITSQLGAYLSSPLGQAQIREAVDYRG